MCKHAYSSLNAAEHRSARPWKGPTSRTTGTQLAANAAQAPIGESIKRDRPGVGSHEDGGSLTETNDAARDARLLSAAGNHPSASSPELAAECDQQRGNTMKTLEQIKNSGSKRACQGGRTNSGELLSSPPMVTPLLTFSTACLTGIQAIPTLPLISPASPGIFSPVCACPGAR